MLTIAICDDLDVQIVKNKEVVQETFKDLEIEIEVDTYFSGEELIKEYEDGKRYDIILMDYSMKGMTGIETVKKIKDYDENIRFIFISSFNEPAPEAIEIGTFRYIIKDDRFKLKLKNALFEAQKKLAARKTIIEIKTKEKTYFLFPIDILYFEASGKKIIAHVTEDEIKFNGSLDSLGQEYKEFGFVRVHRSFLVNMEHIGRATQNDIKLKNGNIIPIGESYVHSFMNLYQKWSFSV